MGKFFEGEYSFNFTWDQVAKAFWRRYPNPYSQHVLSEDVVCREVRDHKLYSKRLLTKTNHVPSWGQRFIHNKAVCIVEESIVDPIQRTIVTYTRNIGFTRVMNVEERCVYRCSMDDHSSTSMERQAWITSGVYGFGRAIQAFGYDRFRKNSTKACQGFNHVLEHMFGGPAVASDRLADVGHMSIATASFKDKAKKATEMAKAQMEMAKAKKDFAQN